jgi:type IV secretion system protein TrbE
MDPWELGLVAGGATIGVANIAGELLASKLPPSLKARRNRQRFGLAGELPWGVLVSDDVVQLKNGALQCALEVETPAIEALSAPDVTDVDTSHAKAHQPLGSRFVLHDYERFSPAREYRRPVGPYPDPYLGFLDTEREHYFNSGVMFRSRSIKVVSWLPPGAAEVGATGWIMDSSERAPETPLETQLAAFDKVINELSGRLRWSGHSRRLGLQRWRDRYGVERVENELLSHILWVVTGLERRVAHPGVGAFVSGLVALPYRAGKDLRVGNLETQIVVVKGYPLRSRAAVLDAIKPLGIPYAKVVRWIPDDAAMAKREMDDAFKLWRAKMEESKGASDPTNIIRAEEAAEAIGLISDDTFRFGNGTVWYVIRHHNRRVAKAAAVKVAETLSDKSYNSFVAELTSEDEYFGTLCGDAFHGVRKFSFHNINLAHLASAHGDPVGRPFAETPTLHPQTPPIVYGRSRNGNPVGVHLYHTPRDVGMWAGVAAMGRGKSFTIGMISCGWLGRAGNTGLTIVEKGGSSYRLNRWLSPNSAFLRPGYAGWPGVALLEGVVPDPEDEDFKAVHAQVVAMAELQGVEVQPPQRAAMREALLRVLDMKRTDLHDWDGLLNQIQDSTSTLQSALREYTGQFNTASDGLMLRRLVSIELTSLLGSKDPKVIIPTLTALLWKIRRSVRRVREQGGRGDLNWGYIIDEAHALLERPQGCAFIADMNREARKEQLWLGLMTQSIEHYTSSPIFGDLRSACGRGFWFRNSLLDRYEVSEDGKPTLAELYKKMGCPDRGLDEIPGMDQFEVGISDSETKSFDVVKWETDAVTQAIIGRSRGGWTAPCDNSRVDDFIRQYGENGPWREKLLEYERVPKAVIERMTAFVQEWKDRYGEEVA